MYDWSLFRVCTGVRILLCCIRRQGLRIEITAPKIRVVVAVDKNRGGNSRSSMVQAKARLAVVY